MSQSVDSVLFHNPYLFAHNIMMNNVSNMLHNLSRDKRDNLQQTCLLAARILQHYHDYLNAVGDTPGIPYLGYDTSFETSVKSLISLLKNLILVKETHKFGGRIEFMEPSTESESRKLPYKILDDLEKNLTAMKEYVDRQNMHKVSLKIDSIRGPFNSFKEKLLQKWIRQNPDEYAVLHAGDYVEDNDHVVSNPMINHESVPAMPPEGPSIAVADIPWYRKRINSMFSNIYGGKRKKKSYKRPYRRNNKSRKNKRRTNRKR